nr:DUF3499 domain-containing protein [Arsenicicoccus dermatophilus]
MCSKTPCGRPAVATLTYVYAESQVVVGTLATFAEPHSYDLCADHARRLTAPRGWDVVRLVPDFADPAPAPDELVAIADAVRDRREQAAPQPERQTSPPRGTGSTRRTDSTRRTIVAATGGPTQGARPIGQVTSVEVGRRAHLRVLREEADGAPRGRPRRSEDGEVVTDPGPDGPR